MRWIERLVRRARAEREMDAELAYHLERRVDDLMGQGVDRQEALRRVRVEFGGTEQIREACRDARGTRWLDDFGRDCRHGLRALRKSPVFTTVAVLSLGFGIGANTAIFTLMDRTMFRSMPVTEPSRLVQITRFHPPYGAANVSMPLFRSLHDGVRSLDGLFAVHKLGIRDIRIGNDLEPADFDLVSGSYFGVLGLRAAAGHFFTGDVDMKPGAVPVVVISYRYWERRFGLDTAVIGMTFERGATVFTIVGVMPKDFTGTQVGREADIAAPLSMDAQVKGTKSWLDEPNYNWLRVMGRLRQGTSIDRARAEVTTVFSRIRDADARQARSDRDRRARLGEYIEVQEAANGFDDLRRQFGDPLRILLGIASLVLLLACANLANMLLARGAARRREFAVRLSVGAGQGRIARQLITEGLLVSAIGGVAGVMLAYPLADRIVGMMSTGETRILQTVRPDARVLLFASAVSLLACMLFSLVPAIRAVRRGLQPDLAEARGARWHLGRTLIVSQMAISVMLLTGAGLFGRSLLNIYTLDPGFNRHGITLFSTNGVRLGFDRARMQRLQMQLPAELRDLPGIRSASVAMFAPVSGGGWDGAILAEGYTGSNDLAAHMNSVGQDYFRTFGTELLAGREFENRDTPESPRVAVVNEAFARHYFGQTSPLGKWIAMNGAEKNTHYAVVGVARDAKYESMRHDFPPTVYLAASQVQMGPDSYMFAVRTEGANPVPMIESVLRHFDGNLRPVGLISMEDRVSRSLARERILAMLGALFGGLALLLSAIGIYGAMAFQVARRRREIGIRMALGADTRSVLGLVLGQTTVLTMAGCVLGSACGLAVTSMAEKLLYGVRPNDPMTFGVAIAGVLSVALLAAYLPGQSAVRTDPTETLRAE